jgi:hypothetical protein
MRRLVLPPAVKVAGQLTVAKTAIRTSAPGVEAPAPLFRRSCPRSSLGLRSLSDRLRAWRRQRSSPLEPAESSLGAAPDPTAVAAEHHEERGTASRTMAFGVGCLHFAPRYSSPERSGTEFLETVAAVLRQIGCDPVDCGCYEGDEYRFTTPATIPDLSEGEQAFPFLPLGHVEFGVEIPDEEQHELLPLSLLPVEATAFFVRIEYCYWNPIAFVGLRYGAGAERPLIPSIGVAIVREWLRKRLGTTSIQLQTLSPSPFHGEFYLRAASDIPQDEIKLRRTDESGRPTYEFSYDPRALQQTEALGKVFGQLRYELDLFYRVVSEARLLSSGVDETHEALVDVMALQDAPGIKACVQRRFTMGRRLGQTFALLAQLQATTRYARKHLDDSAHELYGAQTSPFLRDEVDREISSLPSYPSDESRTMLDVLEQRRLSSREVHALWVSAIGGGLVGALVAAVLGSGSRDVTVRAPPSPPIICRQLEHGQLICSEATPTTIKRSTVTSQTTSSRPQKRP